MCPCAVDTFRSLQNRYIFIYAISVIQAKVEETRQPVNLVANVTQSTCELGKYASHALETCVNRALISNGQRALAQAMGMFCPEMAVLGSKESFLSAYVTIYIAAAIFYLGWVREHVLSLKLSVGFNTDGVLV